MYYIIIAAAVILDQLVKFLVRTNMDVHQSIPVIENVFHLTYVQNTGAAFSIFSGHTGVLALFTLVITAGLMIYLHSIRKTGHWMLKLSISFITAGGIGNIIDRTVLNYVVDFFDFRIWPVFNIADIFVCTGCALLLIYVFLEEPGLAAGKNGSRGKNTEENN